MLDIVYLTLTLALFALISLTARGVERTGPRARGSAQRDAMGGEARG